MEIVETMHSPTKVIVTEYRSGLLIDCTAPPESTDIDKIRRSFSLAGSDQDLLLRCTNEFLMKLRLTKEANAFEESVCRFTRETSVSDAINGAIRRLAQDTDTYPETPAERIKFILDRTGLLREPEHLPMRLYCRIPGTVSEIPDDGTHFGYVVDGDDNSATLESGEHYPLYRESYFSIPGAVDIRGSGRMVIWTRIKYQGYLSIGGKVPKWGALKYIDGCTDSILVPPMKFGDPCLNALFFPVGTKQTRHYHPSVRAGMVIQGSGVCGIADGQIPLTAGNLFFLPPEAWHAFETANEPIVARSALTVTAFHPDSDFGPTDPDHPMINRTYSLYYDRLRSAVKAQ